MAKAMGYRAATSEDLGRYERDKEKARLIGEICVLHSEQDGVKEAIKMRRSRLDLLLQEDGDPRKIVYEGEAYYQQRPTYKVVDVTKLGQS